MPVMQDLELRLVPDGFHQFKLVFKRREKSVAALHLALDEREIKVGTARQRLRINLRAAADEDVVREFRRVELVQRLEDENFRLHLFAQLREVKLAGSFQKFPAAPLVVL